MDIIKELKNIDKDTKITILIKNPGVYEMYESYFLGDDKDKLKKLKSIKDKDDLIPEFTVGEFLEYYKGRQLIKEIHREGKILQFSKA